MPELSSLAFAAVVLGVVALTLVVPRLRSRSHKQTTHDMYFGPEVRRMPQQVRVPAPPVQTTEPPVGAPRAASPVAATGQPTEGTPESLKLPVYR